MALGKEVYFIMCCREEGGVVFSLYRSLKMTAWLRGYPMSPWKYQTTVWKNRMSCDVRVRSRKKVEGEAVASAWL